MKNYILIFLCIASGLVNLIAQETNPTTYTLLKNAYIIDGIGTNAKKGDLLIKNSEIAEVNYETAIAPPKGAIIYDLSDKYLIPGLIDAHVHFGTDPSNRDNLEDTKKRLHYLLKNGITTVRDMAGDTRFLAFLARAAALNEIPAPDIYYAALMAGATFFDDPRTHSSAKGAKPGHCPWMKAVHMDTDMRLAIAEAKGTSATGIKVYADLKAEVIQKIVREAHLQNLKVWSHATVFPAKPTAIVAAGVDVVSHSTLLAWAGVDTIPTNAKSRYVQQKYFDVNRPVFKELVDLMQLKGTILDATLAIYQHARFDTTIFQQGIVLTKLAYENGVKIGVGTDMGVSDFPKIAPLFKEMELLVNRVGMSPLEVLKATTSTNAEMIGQEGRMGTLLVGKLANIVVLKENPLMDISNINSVKYVFKRGQVINF